MIDHFKIHALTSDCRRIAVGQIDGGEAFRLAFGCIDALGGIALSFGNFLERFALRTWNHLIATFFGLVDEALSLLLGLINFIESRFDWFRRGHVLEFDGADLDT